MSDFTARIIAELDTSKIPGQISSISKTPVNLNNVVIKNVHMDTSNLVSQVQAALSSQKFTVNLGKVNFGGSGTSGLSKDLADRIKSQISTGGIEASIAKVTAQYEKMGASGHSKLSTIQNDIKMLNTLQAQLNTSADDQTLVKNYEKFSQTLAKVKNNLTTVSAENKTFASSFQLASFDNKVATWMDKNTKASKLFGGQLSDIRARLSDLSSAGAVPVSQLNALENEFNDITLAAQRAGATGKTFGDQLKGAFSGLTKYVSVSTIIYQSINALKEMYQNVMQIDSAMTELRKVTDESEMLYNNFLKSSGTSAKQIGTTITALVNSTADFARLGYSFQASQELAKVANIYAVVGDEIDSVDTATKSIISTMTAFGVASDDSISIVDKFNEVGNNFAISSGGIGDAMERSASSLAAANNTLDESIALITAANTVVQNPDVIGTAFKTISMRIRGAKTELEEAGLETDGMVESVSTLRTEIKALSGVDIMETDNTFKSTYQIMDELSAKWKDLSDIQQATITELIAGKRQGNVISSLMENFDIARQALETSSNAEGSAMKEHEKWMESLEAKTLQLQAAWEGLSQSFMDSGFLKGLVGSMGTIIAGLSIGSVIHSLV